MKFKYILLISVLFFSSCFGVKFKAKKSPKQFYETFFIEQGVLQYFVKPIKFKSDDSYLTVDFTFRDTLKYSSYVTTNYSIFSEEPIKQVDSAFFVFDNKKVKLKECERFFIDLKKKTYQIRNSCGITYQELIDITDDNPELWVYYNGSLTLFYPTKKSTEILKIVKTQIIDIIELNKD